jgi:BirA family biotin operon repressor/biotin-[acetyl-CoA-carboxylase] ligase
MWLNLERVEERLTTSTIGRRIVYLTSTPSTQDVARREAEDGAAEGTAVIAEEQSAGRGRLGRSWVSPAGKNIYLTIVLRPDLARLRTLGMAAPLAVLRAVKAVTSLEPDLKWPNDVLLSGRKLAGVLIDSELAGGEVKYALAGIGVNVNFDVEESSDVSSIATSLKREFGRSVSREEFLAALLNEFEDIYSTTAPSAIRAAWRDRLETLGRNVTVTFRGVSHEGVAEDITPEGSLVLRCADGSLLTIEAGEVTLRRP